MNHQAYTSAYRTAMEAAKVEMDGLFEEARQLRNRMEQIDSAMNALKPLLASTMDGQPTSEATPAGSRSYETGSEVTSMKEQIDSAFGLVFA